MQIVNTTELQNNFGKYLQMVIDGIEITIIKNGKEVARLISKDKTVSYLSDSLLGVIKDDISEKEITKKRILEHEGFY
ncbi:MAG: type II toxin-antitoxin system prevent-host-death family antitoxin [Firmicutes bacterium]|nr:type II toxin-antitoxin system prevent-host-death family antitoxin [Candidatus Colivicinus equi]